MLGFLFVGYVELWRMQLFRAKHGHFKGISHEKKSSNEKHYIHAHNESIRKNNLPCIPGKFFAGVGVNTSGTR